MAVQFQLDANQQLNDWEDRWKGSLSGGSVAPARADLRQLWAVLEAGPTAELGHWDKILKRAYSYAAIVDLGSLEGRAPADLIRYPDVAERIFQYFARRGRIRSLIALFDNYVQAGENLFEATENAFFEALMLTRPVGADLPRIRALAARYAQGKGRRTRALPRASAVLALYWLGRPVDELATLYDATRAPRLPKEVARAWMASTFARDPARLPDVRKALLGHPSDDVARLSQFLESIEAGSQLEVTLPAVRYWGPTLDKFYDSRSWLQLEVLSHTTYPRLRSRIRYALNFWAPTVSSQRERAILERIRRRV